MTRPTSPDGLDVLPAVLLADDHAPTRSAIRSILINDGWTVTAEAATAGQAVELARRLRPGLCLLDIAMPGGGISAAENILADDPEAAVVMLTHSEADAHLFAALRAGARGYLLKSTDPDRLGQALRGVLSGEAAIPRSLVARVLAEFRDQAPGRFRPRSRDPLTPREREIMELLKAGLTTSQIARQLFITPGTVRVHVSGVLRKLRVTDRDTALRRLSDS